jgi:hypothetical protein
MFRIIKYLVLFITVASAVWSSDDSPVIEKLSSKFSDNREVLRLGFPYYIPEIKKTIFVEQNQACILKGDQSEVTTLFTDNLCPCIGVGVINKKNKNIGLAHIDLLTDLSSLNRFFKEIIGDTSSDDLTVHLHSRLKTDFEKSYGIFSLINTGKSKQSEWFSFVEKYIKENYKIKNLKITMSKNMEINIQDKWDDCVKNIGVHQEKGFFTCSRKREGFYRDRENIIRYNKKMEKKEVETLYLTMKNNRDFLENKFKEVDKFFELLKSKSDEYSLFLSKQNQQLYNEYVLSKKSKKPMKGLQYLNLEEKFY